MQKRVMISSVTKKQFKIAIVSPVILGWGKWFLQAGRYQYVTKGGKPLRAAVCFTIEHAHPHDTYVTTSNDITLSCLATKFGSF